MVFIFFASEDEFVVLLEEEVFEAFVPGVFLRLFNPLVKLIRSAQFQMFDYYLLEFAFKHFVQAHVLEVD